MVVEISCFAALAIPMFLQRKEDIGSNIPCKQLNQYFNLPLPTNLGLESVRFLKIPLTFVRSLPCLSKTKQMRKLTSFHVRPSFIKHKNISKFEFLSHQACGTQRGKALS